MIHNLGFRSEGYEDLRVPLTTGKLGVGAPPDFEVIRKNAGGTSTGVFAYAFSPTTAQQIYFAVQMPHSWLNGTTVTPHVHWTADSTETDVKVSWGMEYTLIDIGGTFPVTTTVYGDTPMDGDTGVTAYKHYITSLGSGIDMSAITGVSSMFLCRLFRDATGVGGTDTFTDDAFGLEIDFHYYKNRMGSPTVSG